ncbi:FAD-dependent monooxygenase [Microbacterium sp. C5A9]|uniref:FAD-dependent monooxygenase n=1 Tax=Microbacterium sp. C5A9 TaxID=2736663 RepID=UPI001F5244AC|nr:FAD-dependent monooxygenase [Microbacterium sp. C5A9]MCI1020456.1 FAD-dependent monooxygenase [Microbacterium sp. C5A9]
MTAVQKVAIAGTGVAGLAAAILLAKAGVEVDVFEAKDAPSTLGSGISLQGNALRVFDALGAWDEIRAAGFPFEGLTLRAPGPGAPVVAALPDVKTGGPDYPAAMGMPRAELTRILLDHARAAGAEVRFGATVTGLEARGADAVEVFVNDESVGDYDLLIGADGLHSAVRQLIGIETKPETTGMGIWRVFVSRPADVDRSELYYGGPMYIAGYTPTGDDSMYAFLVEDAQDRFDVSGAEATQIMLEASRAYDGPWNSIRTDLEAGAVANYTWFTQHVVPAPWNRGRVIVIGDAAHSCPPTIAQGAAQGLEDAFVLTELLTSRDAVDDSLFDEFHARRLPRAQAVVEASVQLGRWQLEHDREADAGGLIFGIAQQMAVPV